MSVPSDTGFVKLLHHSTSNVSQVNINIPPHLFSKSTLFSLCKAKVHPRLSKCRCTCPHSFPFSSCWWWTHKILILAWVWLSYVAGLVTRLYPQTWLRVGHTNPNPCRVHLFFFVLFMGVFRFALCLLRSVHCGWYYCGSIKILVT